MLGLMLDTEALSDETAVVSVAGELDMYTAPSFEQELVAALVSGTRRVVVDLSKCEFLDSTALRVLLRTRASLEDKSRLVLAAPDRSILRVFQITGLERLFTIERAVPPAPPLRAISA